MNRIAIAILASLLSFTTLAETVTIPIGQQGAENQAIKRPKQGQSMVKIESLFGQPLEKTSPVGTPPISKWIYNDFSVYFENNIVIHTVIHQTQPSTSGMSERTTNESN